MKKDKNTLIIVCSVIVGVAAAVAATLVVLKYIKDKKEKLTQTNYIFENDFDDDAAEQESECE